MKRQKRDLTSRAYVRGYRAGVSGKSKDICPATAGESRQHWISGWRQGRSDFWDGYQGISNLHCTPNLP
ncbi:ribosome modulation factor [Motiliproteus coralliicola]|uniref:Ribosome modulation factor n=1 Tax=Motiliproteus coralliicola TaxID=2283196 RepID=A0A369WTW6_9GAMM|nr:ribosome modulation factor [Motiliproteus coralliicola]RDE24499.1 ribosome modulation factor [Motiliproteus coralliicola]